MDDTKLHQAISSVTDELGQKFPSIPTQRVSDAVDEATAELLPGATVLDYLPILIWRRAHARLDQTPEFDQ